ncbi:MAG: hypothetical protein OIF34_12515 [Porticoccaceae bacterium]|nr:hypothetical protein [Porticoccaceae bacterium]
MLVAVVVADQEVCQAVVVGRAPMSVEHLPQQRARTRSQLVLGELRVPDKVTTAVHQG